MKSRFRKVRSAVSLLLSVSLIFSSIPSSAVALDSSSKTESSVQVKQINQNSFEIIQGSKTSTLTINDNQSYRNVTITDNTTGKKSFLIYNKEKNEIFSSITNKTISLSDRAESRVVEYSRSSILKANGKISYKYVSYRTVRNAVGSAGGVSAIVGVFLLMVPGAQVATAINTIVGGILGGLQFTIPDQSNHGFKLTYEKKTTRYIRNGKPVYLTSNVITNVTTY